MKKTVKILAGITAFLLIGGILWFANGLLGNPVSKALANNTAKKYISENYSDMGLEIEEVAYSFKDGCYHTYVKSPTSKDTYFTVSISPLGKIGYDSYEDNVAKKFNTYRRMDELYRNKVKGIFENKDFPYKNDLAFGEVKKMPSDKLDGPYSDYGPVYGLDLSELELDKNYDIDEIGEKYGYISINVQDKYVSIERASEILLDIKNILDKKKVSFYAIDFTLEKARKEDETVNPNGKSINIQQFLYSDIYEEGLENRIKEASDNLQKYYEEQDKIKQKEEMETIEE